MFAYLRPALVTMLAFTLLTGLVYPLALTGIANALFPAMANGSAVKRDGVVVGSALIGQRFTADKYFHGRPSAAGADGYDASASSGSNLGPLSTKLMDRVAGDVAALRAGSAKTVPADAVTTSASGLDPHVSPAYAELQVARVARARGLAPEAVRAILARQTERPLWGVFGEPRVNVLQLNLALDAEPAPPVG